MNDIEQKALALLNEVLAERVHWQMAGSRTDNVSIEALCRAIEQHEAFRQEVSDAVSAWHFNSGTWNVGKLMAFIIPAPKPDPLVEVMEKLGWYNAPTDADQLRAALDAAGFEIREKNDD